MLSLYIRNIIFFFLQPGIVAGLVPYILVGDGIKEIVQGKIILLDYLGMLFFIIGLAVLLYCIYKFIVNGKGTLSPVDRTEQLVINGLYKYTRNPMYVGVILILLGETIFFKSLLMLFYTLSIFVAFHLFVIFIEEPRLRRDFKEEYILYSTKVRRWL